jgi:hypothetical protein
MNIDDLKVSELRQLAAMAQTLLGGKCESKASPMVGKYCLVRCYSAGVHCGTVVSQDGDVVVLSGARRLWSWAAKSGVALSGVAVHGLKSGKVDSEVQEILLTGAIEVIPCTEAAKASIVNA